MVDRQTVIDAFTEMSPHYKETVDSELRLFWGIGYDEFIGRLLVRMDLKSPRHVLDLATGHGVIPLALARRSEWQGRAVGVDITAGMLRGAREEIGKRRENGRVRLVCGSAMELPFAAGSFDVAVCALATHHMNVPTLLAELQRVLRPGGQLLVADVTLASFWRSLAGRVVLHILLRWFGRREGAARFRAELDALPNFRTPDQWREVIGTAGFRDTKLSTISARRRWYPPGILIDAFSGLDSRSGSQ